MDNSTTTSPLSNIGIHQIMPALKVFLDGAVHRGELVALEMSRASEQAVLTLSMVLLSAALVLLGGFAATFMLASAVWDHPDRTLILGLAALVLFAASGVLVWLAWARIRGWRPFGETRRQLRRDNDCLQSLLSPTSEQTTAGNGHV